MGTIVIKPDRDRDLYVGWSTIVESPVWWGTREQAAVMLAEYAVRHPAPQNQPEQRLARADRHGTSDLSIREGGWADPGFVYEQRGWLPRRHLAALCEALGRNDEPAAWDLLEPFDDQTEVRRG